MTASLPLSTVTFNESLIEDVQPVMDSEEQIFVKVAVTVSTLLAVSGTVLNVIVLNCIRLNKKLRTTNGILVFNLGLNDLIMCLICVPMLILVICYDQWPLGHGTLGQLICKLARFIINLHQTVTAFLLVIMSCVRYLTVVRNSREQVLKCKAMIAIGAVWLLAFLFSIYSLTTADVIHAASNRYICKSQAHYRHNFGVTIENTIYLILLFIVPFCLIARYYICILKRLKAKGQHLMRNSRVGQRRDGGRSSVFTNFMKRQQKVRRLVVLIMVMFCVVWLPAHTMKLYYSVRMDFFPNVSYSRKWQKVDQWVSLTVICFVFGSAIINPILFALISQRFITTLRHDFTSLRFRILNFYYHVFSHDRSVSVIARHQNSSRNSVRSLRHGSELQLTPISPRQHYGTVPLVPRLSAKMTPQSHSLQHWPRERHSQHNTNTFLKASSFAGTTCQTTADMLLQHHLLGNNKDSGTNNTKIIHHQPSTSQYKPITKHTADRGSDLSDSKTPFGLGTKKHGITRLEPSVVKKHGTSTLRAASSVSIPPISWC